MSKVACLASSHSRLMQRLCCLPRQAQHLKHCLPQSQQRLPKLILVACTCASTKTVSESLPCMSGTASTTYHAKRAVSLHSQRWAVQLLIQAKMGRLGAITFMLDMQFSSGYACLTALPHIQSCRNGRRILCKLSFMLNMYCLDGKPDAGSIFIC